LVKTHRAPSQSCIRVIKKKGFGAGRSTALNQYMLIERIVKSISDFIFR